MAGGGRSVTVGVPAAGRGTSGSGSGGSVLAADDAAYGDPLEGGGTAGAGGGSAFGGTSTGTFCVACGAPSGAPIIVFADEKSTAGAPGVVFTSPRSAATSGGSGRICEGRFTLAFDTSAAVSSRMRNTRPLIASVMWIELSSWMSTITFWLLAPCSPSFCMPALSAAIQLSALTFSVTLKPLLSAAGM